MSQNRTALFVGIIPDNTLRDFLDSDEGARVLYDNFYPDIRRSSDGTCLGYPFAVAYDPPDGCAELPLPLHLPSLAGWGHAADSSGSDAPLPPEMSEAWVRASKKWSAFAKEMRRHGWVLPKSAMYLVEMERP